MSASLVGSEMCIRDSLRSSPELLRALRSSPELSGALRSSPKLSGALTERSGDHKLATALAIKPVYEDNE
eukprot:9381724-Alexandrium_andersonii.AAC.1